MKIDICPFCGSSSCIMIPFEDTNFVAITCDTMTRSVFVSYDTIIEEKDDEKKNKILNLISEFSLHYDFYFEDGKKKAWFFYYDPTHTLSFKKISRCINVADLMSSYPKTFVDKADRILINLSKRYQGYGDAFLPENIFSRYLFVSCPNLSNVYGMIKILKEFGFLSEENNFYHISAEGWKRIDALSIKQKELKQGFIAMAFRDETKPIREAFRSAILESGFAVRVIDEKEHNNQIVPEIFFEIERSKFVVVDVTYPNYGAYYEAGYAQALGKQVIICCREEEFNNNSTRPHFDISQKSMIVWKNEEDLIDRLKKRIQATVK